MRIAVGMQDDINAFIEEQKQNELRPLGDHIIETILKGIISGDCHIIASKTDHDAKKMWVEFTWAAKED